MNKDTIIKEDYRLPIEIINKVNENFKTIHNKSSSFLSSIIETEFYTKGVLERIMEKMTLYGLVIFLMVVLFH